MADSSSQEKPNPLEQYLKDKRWIDEPEIPPWYVKDLVDLQPKTKELFETYSKIPSDDVVSHITKTKDQAFKIFPYPCLGHWSFLNLSIQKSAAYDEVLERIKGGEQKLVHDGAPSENTYASDLKAQFWDIGYDLFLDKSSLKTTFIEADVFDDNSGLQQLAGKLDIVHAALFFHLFDWDGQVAAAKKIVGLLNPASDNLILGRQAGRAEAGDFTAEVERTKSRFWHNPESWAKLWKQVGDETGTEWKVQAESDDRVDLFRQRAGMGRMAEFIPHDTKFMRFVIRKA
ncbi:hypothetical protein EJ07DRAFT_165895 [Lizonia empirigonia]|nr:hypothetical protein EJ07DRAFT_165895 [Lizonia empirigonia]